MTTLKYFLFALIAAAAVSAYFLNDNVRSFVDEHLLSSQEVIPSSPNPQMHIFVLADGTGSNKLDYDIPQVDTAWLHSLIQQVYLNGGGKVWLSYIDANQKNNPAPPYISVPAHATLSPEPTILPGESRPHLRDRQIAWNQKSASFHSDSIRIARQFSLALNKFLLEAEHMLTTQAYAKRSEHLHTDVVAAINQAAHILSSHYNNKDESYIIAFSDLKHDPIRNNQDSIQPLPRDLKILALQPGTISTHAPLKPYTQSLSNPELIFEKLFE